MIPFFKETNQILGGKSKTLDPSPPDKGNNLSLAVMTHIQITCLPFLPTVLISIIYKD